jgi:NitT/TauT family transport system substrate-binding protein
LKSGGLQESRRPLSPKSYNLVRGIVESSEWAETHRLDAAAVAAPYFRRDEKVVRYVLTQPPDRVSYRMLTPTDEEMRQIHDMALKAGIPEKPIDMKDLIDRSFIPAGGKPAAIKVN